MQQDSESGYVAATGNYRWAAFSETGARVRNEDRWGHRRSAGGLELWVVADGMGGHDDGDVAAEIAVNAFLDAGAAQDDPEQAVRSGMAAARQAVGALRGDEEKASAPSSTLVGLALKGARGFVGHAGDSPLYQFRRGKLVHRTRDHNVRELKRAVAGTAALPQAMDPDASQLTRSLGSPLNGDAEDVFSPLELRTGDLMMLCSDGVSQHIPEDEPGAWAAKIKTEAQLIELACQVVTAANHPRQDNYTAVAIAVADTGASAALSLRPWLIGAAGALALAAVAVSGFNAWQGYQEDPAKALAAKAPASKQAAPAIAAAGPTPGSRTAPPVAAPAGTVTVTRSPAVGSQPARTVRTVIAPPGETCREMKVSEPQCSDVEKIKTVCDSRPSRTFTKRGRLSGAWSSPQEAERSCQRQAEAAMSRSCNGTVDIRELDCQCEEGDDLLSGAYCNFRAQAECRATDQICEEVKVIEQDCKAVLVSRLVCEKR